MAILKLILLLATVNVINGMPVSDDPSNPSQHFASVFDRIFAANSRLITDKNAGGLSSQGKNFFEADIVMTNALRAYLLKQKNDKKVANDAIVEGRWPKGVVPYIFDSEFVYQDVVKEAIEEYDKDSCVKFVARTTETDYLNFHMGGGCWSFIGRIGGKQDISLDYGCGYKGIAMHEMLHAIGFFHEQSRRDRDGFVTINWDNIMEGFEDNFKMHDNGEAKTLNEPYDKESIMHYGNWAFANDTDKMTIVSMSDPDEMFGQREGLSKIDKKQLNKYYKCDDGDENVKTTTRPSTTLPATTATEESGIDTIDEDCSDSLSCCVELADNEVCSQSKWVREKCKLSCNSCPVVAATPETEGPCIDVDTGGSCPGWAVRGDECGDFDKGCCDEDSGHRDYMNFYCKKSCAFC